jgi:hypothetical protein
LTKPEAPKGTIISQEADRTVAGNQRTIVTETTPKDQVAESFDESAAASSKKTLHTENATDLTKPEAPKGTIISQEADRTVAGNQRTIVTETTPKDQVSVEGEETGFNAVARTIHTENPLEPSVAASAPGKKTSLRARRTEAGNLGTVEEEDTSKAVSVAEFVSHYGEREIETTELKIHDLTPPAISDETGGGIDTRVLAYEFDAYLTHSYKVVKTTRVLMYPEELSWEIYGDTVSVTSQVWSETLGRYWNNATYIYREKWTHTRKSFSNKEDASAFIANSGTWPNVEDTRGSHFGPAGDFEWIAEKVVKTRHLITTYTYTEPAK